MSEGRKTRRFGGGMTGKAKEKAKLNREWQQISAVSHLLRCNFVSVYYIYIYIYIYICVCVGETQFHFYNYNKTE